MQDSGSEICINGYDFLSSEGNGSIGSVFKAKKDKKFFAIKMINKNQIDNMNNFYMMMQKLEKLENENHNNINPLNIFIGMEYCNQGNLLQYMCKQPEKRLECFRAIELFAQILNGFKFLHQNKIQHRNLKPQNILMHNDKPKISDYGVYLIYNGQESRYQMREFMSPENYEHQSDSISHLCDMWGLGVLLFFMIFNTWPFKDFQDIRNFTYNKQFSLIEFLSQKNIEYPPTLQNTPKVIEMLTELFQGLFVYESKNRMTFMQLCKHQIFLKVKNFNMDESILFYFHEEKNLLAMQNGNNFMNFKFTNVQTNQNGVAIQNLTGLPGVSARSMYSGDVLDDLNSNDKVSIMISTQNLQVKRVHSSKQDDNQENLNQFNLDQSKIMSNIQNNLNPIQIIKLQLEQSANLINMSINSELNQESPVNHKIKKKEMGRQIHFLNDEIYSFQNEAAHGPSMLSSFGKKKFEQQKNNENKCDYNHKSFSRPPQKIISESETDFENTEEFDSLHREINTIPQFMILKACKMVNFQFRIHQDENVMNLLDSYSLSSVISIPRPYSYPETDIQKRYISSLYDLEIYRYRFIEETVRILKNVYNEAPIINYQLLVLAEHYALKNAFFIAKTLLQKIQNNDNFLKVETKEFIKYFTQQCHIKYIEILEKDLQRLYTQYYLTSTQLQNQGINQQTDPIEQKYFFFKRNSINNLHEATSIDESDIKITKPSHHKIRSQQSININQNNNNQNNTLVQKNLNNCDNNPNYINSLKQKKNCNNLNVEETPSFSKSKNVSLTAPQSTTLKTKNVQHYENCQFSILQLAQTEKLQTESVINEINLDEKHINHLQSEYNKYLNKIFKKLKNFYNINGDSHFEQNLKIIKLALRILMCIRHGDVFDKTQIEQILILFQSNSNNNGNSNNNQNQSSNQMVMSNKVSNLSMCQSLTTSIFGKKQKGNNPQVQFSIENLVKWVNYCTKSEALKQISILIKDQN